MVGKGPGIVKRKLEGITIVHITRIEQTGRITPIAAGYRMNGAAVVGPGDPGPYRDGESAGGKRAVPDGYFIGTVIAGRGFRDFTGTLAVDGKNDQSDCQNNHIYFIFHCSLLGSAARTPS